MRALVAVFCLIAAVLAAGCSSSPGAAARDGGADAGPELPDPRLFDCTSLGVDGGWAGRRTSPVPVACGLDPACRTKQISGHRGAGGPLGVVAPEDTLAAYRAAIVMGIEYGETDPRPTADGVIVNVHDTTVDRTTDGRGTVSEMTFSEVRALRPLAGDKRGDFSCERIPTLREVLETCRGKLVVLVDANKTDRVDLLVQAIREADALDWAIFDTSDVGKIDRALAMEPRLHFMIRPEAGEVEEQLDHFAPRVPAIVEVHDLVSIAVVHERGLRALMDVFVGDFAAALGGDFSGYDLALDGGVDILQTDRPDLVKHVLRARGLR